MASWTDTQRKSFLANLDYDERVRFDRWLSEQSWRDWVHSIFRFKMRDMAPHHDHLWDWAWAIKRHVRPRPFVGIWPRGAAKSTNAEIINAMIGARGLRKYALYVCETQDQADKHVASIASLLDTPAFADRYPLMAMPDLNKFGNLTGWRRNRLQTRAGFTLDALGLNKAGRGAKVEEYRPDFITLDDIDASDDSPGVTEAKIELITRKWIPAGSRDLAILAIQNLVHEHSIFSRLAGMIPDERADFLLDRIVSGPIRALEGAAYEQNEDGDWFVTAGTPTWQGMDVEACNAILRDAGYISFLVECQQEVFVLPGGMYDDIVFRHVTYNQCPEFVRTTVWVDPSVTNTDKSDSMGIQCDALAIDGRIYRLYSWEGRTSPEDALERAIMIALHHKSLTIGVETDQGGDAWLSVFLRAKEKLASEGVEFTHEIAFIEAKAGAGNGNKVHRNSLMHAAYMQDMFRHVLGSHEVLERALKRFPRAKPYDLADAAYWCYHDLAGDVPFESAVGGVGSPLNQYVPM